MTPRRALASALLAAALALGACGGGGGNGDENAEEAEGGPPTPAEAYSGIVARIAEAGSSPELALEAFALAFGPIPGVERPETSDGPNLPSGTGTADLVMHHFDELTPEQQEAIEERLLPGGLRAEGGEGDPPADAADAAGLSGQAGGGSIQLASHRTRTPLLVQDTTTTPTPDPTVVLDRDLAIRARGIASAMARKMGSSINHLLLVGIAADRATRDFHADLWTARVELARSERRGDGLHFNLGSPDDPLEACLIVIPSEIVPTGAFEARFARFTSRIAHEAFHCVEKDITAGRRIELPQWLNEGLPAWAGETWASDESPDAGSGDRYANTEWWPAYFGKLEGFKQRNLFAQSYDAIGFWAQLAAWISEDALWRRIPTLLLNPGSAFADSGAPDQLERWAPQMARQPEFGEDWDLPDFDTRFAVPRNLRLEPKVIDLGGELSQPGDSKRYDIGRLQPRLFEIRMPDTDEIDSVQMTVVGGGAMLWQAPPHENVVIRGTDSRSICFDPARQGCPRSRRGDVLIVAVAGESNPQIEFSAQGENENQLNPVCGGVGGTPEAVVAACAESFGEWVGLCYNSPDDLAGKTCVDPPFNPGGEIEGGFNQESTIGSSATEVVRIGNFCTRLLGIAHEQEGFFVYRVEDLVCNRGKGKRRR